MGEDTARRLPAQAAALDRELGAPVDTVATIPDAAPRRRFDRAVGEVIGPVARDLIFPIERSSRAAAEAVISAPSRWTPPRRPASLAP